VRRCGSSDLHLPILGVGCWAFGGGDYWGPQSQSEVDAVVRHAVEHGCNFFDTAEAYNAGASEASLGAALRGLPRDQVIVGTKISPSHTAPADVVAHCEASLRRLQTDYLDLYQMHHIWREAPWEEIWQAMELLVQQGKVVYIGSSNFAGWHIAQANEIARRRNFLGLVSEQSLYHLNARTVERDLIPACAAYGLGLIPWSPLGGGLLGGVLEGPATGRRAKLAPQIEAHRPKLEAWEKLCRQLGEQPADVALAWLLHQPVVTAPIIGPRTQTQLDGALRALDLQLAPETLDAIDAS
jgi:aryl-alcohol dehydrogenase-like predicted oxidoreductase